MRTIVASAALALATLAFAGCGERSAPSAGSSGAAEDPGVLASIRGTTVDAATGEPLAGVRVVAPGGAEAVSDADGRFSIEGLELGVEGELAAAAADGRRGSNALRPLRAGPLEVVVRLR